KPPVAASPEAGSGHSAGPKQGPDGTQLSKPGRGQTSVSSVAMDRGLLAMAGTPSRPEGETVPPLADGLTDAQIMLQVKSGDTSAFDYLVQKYRRPMLSFMYRMAHNT